MVNIARMLDFYRFVTGSLLGSNGFSGSVAEIGSSRKLTCGIVFSSSTFSRISSDEVTYLNSANGFLVLWTWIWSLLLSTPRVASLETLSYDSLKDVPFGDFIGLMNGPGVVLPPFMYRGRS